MIDPGLAGDRCGRAAEATPPRGTRSAQSFDSFYGNVRFHLDDATELSGGLSILRDQDDTRLNVQTGATRGVATPLSALGGLPCAGIPGVFVTGLVNSNYPGFCDALIPAGVGNSASNFNNKYSDALYNFSLSHKFTDAVLVYATTGTSFRAGLPAISNTGLPSNLTIPEPNGRRPTKLVSRRPRTVVCVSMRTSTRSTMATS
ncbi:hypothetical protein [uncultured Sphingomonas sp.]|uniref:hypothetical protein n=1 Tax=uncultured Sphingomonas sp. TaxID=158754 RepID=UPI0034302B06